MAAFDPQQLQVRPGLRITGVVLMLLIAALMVYSSIPFFSAEKVSLKCCAGERKVSSKLLCEVGNAMLSQVPARMQGPVEALLHLAVSAILIFLSWLLAKPLCARSHEKPF